MCVCVKKSWSLTICCWIFTKRSLFVPFLQQSSNAKKQLKTQGSLGIEHIPVTAKSKIPCFLDLSPPKKQKKSTLKHPCFCCKCLPTDGLWPRWSRLSSQTPALVHVNWLKSITGWLELNHVSLWKDLLKICAICGKLAGTITHWICSGVSRLCFFMPQIMRSTAHGENGQHLTKLEGPALGPTHTLWLIGKCKSSSLNNGKGRGNQDIQSLYPSTQ